jgi:hypothetical protein
MAYKKYARTCSECGKGMNEGYCIDSGCEYYCSDACLHKHHTPEEWESMYADGDGDSYYTEWGNEDPDEYLADEDDPAPNTLSVEMEKDGGIGAFEMFKKQLRDQGLDPDRYEFINWTIVCDVQIKEGDNK